MTYETIAALSAAGAGSALYIAGKVWLTRSRTEVPCDCLPCQERRGVPVLLAPGEEVVNPYPRLPTLHVVARDYRRASRYMDLAYPDARRLWRYVDDRKRIMGLRNPEVIVLDGYMPEGLLPYLVVTNAQITYDSCDNY